MIISAQKPVRIKSDQNWINNMMYHPIVCKPDGTEAVIEFLYKQPDVSDWKGFVDSEAYSDEQKEDSVCELVGEGMSLREIGEIENLSSVAVRNIEQRALAKLRDNWAHWIETERKGLNAQQKEFLTRLGIKRLKETKELLQC
tara:strand:- start:111 stop:539 length:429 start_codon:yes stop_codon:yes gene_type:complete